MIPCILVKKVYIKNSVVRVSNLIQVMFIDNIFLPEYSLR